MSKYLVVLLILIDAFLGRTMADTNTNPAPSEAPTPRKMGKHLPKESPPLAASVDTSLLAPPPEATLESVSGAADPTPGEGQEVHLAMHHGSKDKSVAGGGVILGGLAAVFLVAVFCYIRATRRHKLEATSFTASEISSGSS